MLCYCILYIGTLEGKILPSKALVFEISPSEMIFWFIWTLVFEN
jgi:hypothetical protein